MNLQDLRAVDATVTDRPMTLQLKRKLVIDALRMPGVLGSPLTLWENLSPGKKRSASTKRTVLRAGIEALKRTGVDIEHTVGSFQDHLELNDTQMHWIACNCFLKEQVVRGSDIADRLQVIENGQV
jgi:hypothetical protein